MDGILRSLVSWVRWVVAGFYLSAISLVLIMMVLSQFVEAAGKFDFDLAYWEGVLGLSFLPVIVGFLMLLVSISGALVSGTRFANERLRQGGKSHNPIWGVLLWFVPIYGAYKAYVMGRSIETASGSKSAITSKLLVALFVSWVFGLVSDGSSRTNLDPRTLFLVSLVMLALLALAWFYMAAQTHLFLREIRTLAAALDEDKQQEQEFEVDLQPSLRSDALAVDAPQKFCTNCGHVKGLNSKFCGECGSSFGQVD